MPSDISSLIRLLPVSVFHSSLTPNPVLKMVGQDKQEIGGFILSVNHSLGGGKGKKKKVDSCLGRMWN